MISGVWVVVNVTALYVPVGVKLHTGTNNSIGEPIAAVLSWLS